MPIFLGYLGFGVEHILLPVYKEFIVSSQNVPIFDGLVRNLNSYNSLDDYEKIVSEIAMFKNIF
jgi:hypothetical protein